MKTLTNTLLFSLFTSYLGDIILLTDELPSAYDDFVTLLAELPQNENWIMRLRRLNYTRIELAFMQMASVKMAEKRQVLYDVFISKALSLLDAEIEMAKEAFRHGNVVPGLKSELAKDVKEESVVTLTWNGTDNDLIELVAALMAADAIGSINGEKLTIINVMRVFEKMFHLKINALYTKRGKVFDRCTDTTPFIDSLRKSYNQMLAKRLV